MSSISGKGMIDNQSNQIYFHDHLLTEEKWKAIIENDTAFNNQFLYAVITTKIFCKPSCKSRLPKKENVRIFFRAEQALSEDFRPCKRCNPINELLPENELIDTITKYIDHHFTEKLTLKFLADISHLSPYHLQRTFKKITGITPVQYIQNVRLNTAKSYLLHTDKAVVDIASTVGITNTSYFVTLFKKKTGQTPNQFRQIQQNLQ